MQVIITCDTESLSFPARYDLIEANIFGKYDPRYGTSWGIPLIMHIADSIGAKVVFFYDVFTEYACPGINARVAEMILSRGHFLELHAHIEHLPDAWWHERGYCRPTWASNYFDKMTVELVYSDALRLFKSCAGRAPTAYRAGSWRYSTNILEYLRSEGLKYSFNYHPLTTIRQQYPHGPDAGPLDVFRWSNGLIEVPSATLTIPNPFSNRQKYVGFESHLLRETSKYFDFVRTLSHQMPQLHHAVLVMHSWALAEFANNQATSAAIEKVEAFRGFLEHAADFGFSFSGEDIFTSLDKHQSQMKVPVEFAGFGNSPLTKFQSKN